MGNRNSIFSKEQMEEYEECTFFTKSEVLRLYEVFRSLCRECYDHLGVSAERAASHGVKPSDLYLTQKEFLKLAPLRHNPFRSRVAKIFTSDPVDGKMSFDDFLDFFSVMSPEATRDVKAFAAFKLYDFDEDGYINRSDILKLVASLVGDKLSKKEIESVTDNIMNEVDIDGDGQLSFVEFDQILSKAPDFVSLFCIRAL